MQAETMGEMVKFIMLGFMLIGFIPLGFALLFTWMTSTEKGPENQN